MDNNTEGLATETSGATLQQKNAALYAESFNAISKPDPMEVAPGTAPSKDEPQEQKKPETTQDESEFPKEVMTGEKEPAPEEKDDLDEIQPTPKMGEASRANFDKLKQAAREARIEVARVKAELEAARNAKPAAAVDNEELTAIKARAAELEAVVEKANFAMSDKFRAVVAEGESEIASAKSFLEGTEIDPAVIDLAARLRGPKRAAALREAGIDTDNIALIGTHLAENDRIEARKAHMLEHAKTERAQWEQQAAAQKEAQLVAERAEEDRVYAEVGAEIAKLFEPFQKIPGADKWNADVDALTQQAKEFFNGKMTIKEMAEIAYYGVGAKKIHRMFHTQRAEVKALKEQLSKLKVAQPAQGSANGHTNGASSNGSGHPKSADELRAERIATFNEMVANRG